MAAGRTTVRTSVAWSKDGLDAGLTISATYVQSGSQAHADVQIVGASSEAVAFGDVTTPGIVGFKNQNADGGSIIYVGTTSPVTSLNAQFTLTAGDGVIFPTTQTAWYALSSSGNSDLAVIAIEA